MPGNPIENLCGQTFGRLKVKRLIGRERGYTLWRCRCSCGKFLTVPAGRLKCGNTRSCGCLRSEMVTAKNWRHGHRHTSGYKVWLVMKDRCLNSKNKNYRNYGGRGITICKRWQETYMNFLGDMGPRPSAKHSIERVDNSKGYNKNNCVWATSKQQGANRRNVRLFVYQGERLTIKEIASRIGMSYNTLYNRLIKFNWPFDIAISASRCARLRSLSSP